MVEDARVLVSVCLMCRAHVLLGDISSTREPLTEKLYYVSTLLHRPHGTAPDWGGQRQFVISQSAPEDSFRI